MTSTFTAYRELACGHDVGLQPHTLLSWIGPPCSSLASEDAVGSFRKGPPCHAPQVGSIETGREAGVNAVGRTINTRFDLDKNYRNTREIMKVAAEFASTGCEQKTLNRVSRLLDRTQTSRYDLAQLLRY